MEKTYTSFKDIERELHVLNLQRKITLEEIKLLKLEYKEDVRPYQWVSTLFSAIKKYGIFYLIKKIIR